MPTVLTLNGGSSSIRIALYDARNATRKLLDCKIDRIGLDGTSMSVTSQTTGEAVETHTAIDARNHQSVVGYLVNWLASQPFFAEVGAVGHRVVHGMTHSRPERVTAALLGELRRIVPYDPEHLPREIELIEAMGRAHAQLPQVACFDTAFIARCRESRQSCPFRGASRRAACSAMDSMACPIRT